MGRDESVEDEELEHRPDRHVPRWLVVLATALAAVVLGTGVVVAIVSEGSDDATPTSSVPNRPRPPRLAIPDGAVVVASGDGRLLFFSGDVLTLLDPSGRILAERRYPVRTLAAGPPQVRLLVDGVAGLTWVVSNDGVHAGYAEKFTYDGLAPLDRIPLPTVIDDVAAVRGELYVADGGRAYRLARDSRRFTRTGPAGVVRVVADPRQLRMLLLVRSAAGLTVVPAGASMSRTALPLVPEPQLAVVDGAVWGVGSLNGRAWIARLDPESLTFGPNYAPVSFGRGVDLAGSGDHSLFVSSGFSLACFDTDARRVVQTFQGESGPVAATRHRAVASGTSGVLRTLPLATCSG